MKNAIRETAQRETTAIKQKASADLTATHGR